MKRTSITNDLKLLAIEPPTILISSIDEDLLLINYEKTNSIDTFSVNGNEEELRDIFKKSVEALSNRNYRTSLENKFRILNILRKNNEYLLNSFQRVCCTTFSKISKGLSMNKKSCRAALNGDLKGSENHIQYYSNYKNQLDFEGTTLSCLIARLKRFHFVKHLSEFGDYYDDAHHQNKLVLIDYTDIDQEDDFALGY